MVRTLVAVATGILVAIALAYVGVSKALGAHIWWDIKTAYLGAPVGAAIAGGFMLTSLPKTIRILLFAAASFAALGLAHFGKTEFAASYAENALAGKFWYFGWIGTSAAVAGLVATLVGR